MRLTGPGAETTKILDGSLNREASGEEAVRIGLIQAEAAHSIVFEMYDPIVTRVERKDHEGEDSRL